MTAATPPISTGQCAKYFCELSDWTLTNLSLQKIIYIAHMVYMGENGGTRLVNDSFEAWDYGPVSRWLYAQVKPFGSSPIKNVFHGAAPIREESVRAFIEHASQSLLKKRPAELVAITHWESGAWARNYKPGMLRTPIPDAHILDEYRARVPAASAAA